ncbi:MAG: class I SAM-dependent RNA methyltransferase [Gemmatirosa sp.]
MRPRRPGERPARRRGGRADAQAPLPPAEPTELTIDSIAAGGDGVGRVGALVAFVPRTAPGDVVRARLRSGGRFARGLLDVVVTPSNARVAPECPHYERDRCGGCQLQHLALDAQLEAKRRIVQDALVRMARRDVSVPPLVPSPTAWRYRRKLTLALRRRGGAWIAGLRAYDDPDAVFALHDCPITDERVVAAWRAILAVGELLPLARELRGAVRLMDAAEGHGAPVAFSLEGGERWPTAERFFEAVPALAALWWQPAESRRRLLFDRRANASPGASFVQVNLHVGALLADAVVAAAQAHAPTTVVDAYSGAGDVAVRLASQGARVTAIELDAEATAYAASRLPAGSRAIAATVEDALPVALPADLVIVNPPRAGLDARVSAALEASAHGAFGEAPRAVLYVSCNPATLARDLSRMPAWTVRRVQPFDMFPQTAHVETLVELVPAVSVHPESQPQSVEPLA